MTLIHRFGSAPNLNIHYHKLFLDGIYVKLFLDGIYVDGDNGLSRFRRVKAHTIAQRIGRFLERQGSVLWRKSEWIFNDSAEIQGHQSATKRFIACEIPVDLG